MTQEELLGVLLSLAEKLRNKFGIEPGIFHEGYIIVKGAGAPTTPVIPEEITSIIEDILKEKKLNFNFTDWPITVNNQNGNLVIRYTPTKH